MVIIIPARYNSSRLPGKPLALVNGVQMIRRVYYSCVQANVAPVYVATDDELIAEQFPPKAVVMTNFECRNGTERCAEAAELLGLGGQELVVNVQGDMPFIPSELISKFCRFLESITLQPLATVVTASPKYKSSVRVIIGNGDKSLIFSRFLSIGLPHIGMYGYSVAALRNYMTAGISDLEETEQLEQLRWLDKGIGQLHVMVTEIDPGPEINTPDDLKEVNKCQTMNSR